MTNFAEARQERIVPEVEWDDLLKSLHEGRCVLLLGPQLLPGLSLFGELDRWLRDPANGVALRPGDVRMAYPADELFLFNDLNARSRVSGKLEAFYRQFAPQFEPLYRKIAELPFPVIVSTMPDEGLRRVFEEKGLAHQFGYYHRKGVPKPHESIAQDPAAERALFNIFGKIGERESLLLTHEDLFDFLRNILGVKPLTDERYLLLNDALGRADDFVFLGFQFDKWYMQLLLRLLNPDASKARQYAFNPELADETLVFFADQFKVDFVDGLTPNQFLDELTRRWQENQARFEAGAPLKQTLAQWLKQGHLGRILEKLAGHPAAEKEATFQLGRLNELNRTIREGTALSEHTSVEMNKIRKAVQDLIEMI